jgi:hypothetical protein
MLMGMLPSLDDQSPNMPVELIGKTIKEIKALGA